MIKNALFFLLLALTLSGCGDADKSKKTIAEKAPDDASNICETLSSNALARLCRVNDPAHTVDVMIESSDEEMGRNTCAAISGKLKPLTAPFNSAWTLQIFSVYRKDKPLASCVLH